MNGKPRSLGHAPGEFHVLVAGLIALAVSRAALTFVPSMWAWSLNLHRFLPPLFAWLPWALTIVVLLPPVARRVAPLAGRVGTWTSRSRLAPFVWAALAMAIVLLLPDHTESTGDFILRRRAVEEGRLPSLVFPQALPLDAWLHYTLPRWLFVHRGIAASVTARAWGAFDAALLALCAVEFARALDVTGGAALAAVGVVLFGGPLALFTGYGKGLAELTVLVAAVGAFSTRVVRQGSGYLGLCVAVALAIAIHRAGFLLAAGLIAYPLAIRRHGRPAWRSLAPLLLPVLTGVLVLGKAYEIFTTFDATHHFTSGGGLVRWTELANALVLVSPLALLVPVLLIASGRSLPRRLEIVPTAAVAVLLLVTSAAIVPQQGIVRDWDVFAPAGMGLSLLVAWLLYERLGADPESLPAGRPVERGRSARQPARATPGAAASPGARSGGLALAVVLAAAVPSIQWLVHLNDVNRGLQRVAAVLAEPPPRSEVERARLWDYVGIRSAWLDDWPRATDAFAQSAALLPTPRVLDQWARAEVHRGDWGRAAEIYGQMIARDSTSLVAWRNYTAVVTRMKDRVRSRDAAEHILRLAPGDAEARSILEYLDHTAPPPRR